MRSSRALGCFLCFSAVAAAQPEAQPRTPADLFNAKTIWNVHLKFTADQWAAMEPKGGGGPALGVMARPEPSMFLAPGFLKGDSNGDGKLSQEEFKALGSKFFSDWDTQKTGKLTAGQLRSGINAAFPLPAFGPGGPGGPGGGRGGPGGPAGMVAKEGKRNGLSGISGIEFEYVKADLDFEGNSFKDVGVRYKGNGSYMMSRNSDKRSLKIDLNQHVKGQRLAGVSTLNLHNCVTDSSWMNEVLSYRLFRDAGVPSPRTAYARVSITVDGKWDKKYIGLYSLVENVDKSFSQENYAGAKGAIFKPATRNLFEHLGDDWAQYQQIYDPKTGISAADRQRVIDFARFVSAATDEEFRAGVSKYLDLEEFSRFMAVTVWLSNMDSILSMGQNYIVYLHPKTNKFQVLPWDLDHSFGQFGFAGSQEQREKLSIHHPWSGANKFLERVFATPAFKKLYLDQLTVLQKDLTRPERLAGQVDELAAVIRPAVRAESADKLARFDKAITGETVAPQMGNGGPPMPMGAAKPIKGFVPARSQAVADQLAGKDQGIAPSGPGGPGGGGPRGPGGPGGFGPAMFLQTVFMNKLDGNKDSAISAEEFRDGFAAWFASWNSDGSGQLTPEQLRSGINRDMAMPGGDGPPRF